MTSDDCKESDFPREDPGKGSSSVLKASSTPSLSPSYPLPPLPSLPPSLPPFLPTAFPESSIPPSIIRPSVLRPFVRPSVCPSVPPIPHFPHPTLPPSPFLPLPLLFSLPHLSTLSLSRPPLQILLTALSFIPPLTSTFPLLIPPPPPCSPLLPPALYGAQRDGTGRGAAGWDHVLPRSLRTMCLNLVRHRLRPRTTKGVVLGSPDVIPPIYPGRGPMSRVPRRIWKMHGGRSFPSVYTQRQIQIEPVPFFHGKI